MSFERELLDNVSKAVKAIHDSEKFVVPVLAVRANKAAQENPHDNSVVMMSNILKKMASNNKAFISRAELNKLYEDVYSPNSKLAELFSEELARPELDGPTRMKRDNFENLPLDHDYGSVGDPVLSNALSAVFDGSNEDRPYSKEVANRAKKICMAELNSIGLPPKNIEVITGAHDVIVCQASYETPKGLVNVLIPVEIKAEKALFPSAFLNNKASGISALNAETLSKHIVALSEIHQKKVDAVETSVADPEVEKTAEHVAFAKRLDSPAGIANYLFGPEVVEAGRNMLRRKLSGFGFGNVQVSVADVDENTISYAASLNNTAGVKIPVKISDGRAEIPTTVIAGGSIDSFTREGVCRLLEVNDSRMLAVASPLYDLKPGELMEQVRLAVAEGNLSKAEDAINVLGEVSPEVQKRALEFMIESFNPETLKKVASEQKGCVMMVTSSVSQHPLCGHLNLPLNKVYQDKHGNCRPLHRKNQEDGEESATFMTHKIFGW